MTTTPTSTRRARSWWPSTSNATAMLAFYAKDALLVVDDFVPTGTAASQQRLQGVADKLLRAQGNSSGRRRLHPDGRLHGNRPPRGLILSTGEDTPRGKSLNARLVLLRFPKGAMDRSEEHTSELQSPMYLVC